MIKSFVRSVGMMAAIAASCVAFVGNNAFGGALTGDSQNNAITFDPSTPTDVEVNFFDSKIALGRYIQVGFKTTGAVFNIGAVQYSYDNVTFNDVTPNFGTVGSAPTVNWTSIVDLLSAPGSSTVYFKYTLPAGLADGDFVQMIFQSNSDGNQSGGVLTDNNVTGNDFVDLTRDHTAVDPVVPEPTTFAIASIGLGLAGVARMRKRAKKA